LEGIETRESIILFYIITTTIVSSCCVHNNTGKEEKNLFKQREEKRRRRVSKESDQACGQQQLYVDISNKYFFRLFVRNLHYTTGSFFMPISFPTL